MPDQSGAYHDGDQLEPPKHAPDVNLVPPAGEPKRADIQPPAYTPVPREQPATPMPQAPPPLPPVNPVQPVGTPVPPQPQPVQPAPQPVQPVPPPPPEPPATPPVAPSPVPPVQTPERVPEPVPGAVHHELRRTLRAFRRLGILLALLVLGAAVWFGLHLAQQKPIVIPVPGATTTPDATVNPDLPVDRPNTISCLSQTGPDNTTESQQFVPVEGTDCTYRSGPSEETLVLSGKLTGRNVDGTGMSVTINVNGKDCNGGESLNYARNWTPMYSNCVFVVPANSAVLIRWRFLSPFGSSAAVLRSSKNIAPHISGVSVPRFPVPNTQQGSPSPTPSPRR